MALYLNAKDLSKIFSCKNLDNLSAITTNICKFTGFSNASFLKCELHNHKILVKITTYQKAAPELCPIKITYNPVETEILVLKLLKAKIIDANISPCILEIFYSRICAISTREIDVSTHEIRRALDEIFRDISAKVNTDLIHPKFSFIVSEQCDMQFTKLIIQNLPKFDIIESDCDSTSIFALYKSWIFQIIHALYAITKIYPGFKHNNLRTDSILLKMDINHDFEKPQYLAFDINGIQHHIAYAGIACKIVDFGSASIPEETITAEFTTSNDLALLFHSINSICAANASIVSNNLYKYLFGLMSSLMPAEIYKKLKQSKQLDDIPSYESMLLSDVFNEYRNCEISQDLIYHEYA